MLGIRHHQFDTVAWVESADDGGKADDLDSSEQADRAEPHDDDRAEIPADMARPVALDHKEGDQQYQGQRQHIGFECGGCDFEALDRAEYRDRRGQHPIAKKQRQTQQSRRPVPGELRRAAG